ncbi:MAG: NlpC/P60 family protein [Pseudomonadota bacterium]
MTGGLDTEDWALPPGFDRRLTPARADLAADWLRGRIKASQFTVGERMTIGAPVADLRPRPDYEARIDTQLLCGETVEVYERCADWLWVRCLTDGYVGYLDAAAAAPAGPPPTHRVACRAALRFPSPDIKAQAIRLPWPARVSVVERVSGSGTRGLFGRLASGGYVTMAQIAPIEALASDWVAEAEALTGVPYLWGGRSADGLDCSALLQLALETAGVPFPRDSDMQAATAGAPGVDAVEMGAGLLRGDLVFWRGHVGVMQDDERLLHANAHHMAVASEPLAKAAARIAEAEGLEILSILRLDPAKMPRENPSANYLRGS